MNIWMNVTDGRVACPSHGGQYLRYGVEEAPARREHDTPLGTWVRATENDVAEWKREGLSLKCEGCPA